MGRAPLQKRVHLELGGNSALLVLDDVDVEAGSSVGAWGSFAHQGQVCMAAGRDRIHGMVTQTVEAGARLAAGTYDKLFHRPTVLADVPVTAPVYGLSLGILTRDVMRGLEIAERIPSGLVHISDQTINDEADIPDGGV